MADTKTKWSIAHSGFANTPFVIFEGYKAPNFSATHPLQGVRVIAEVPQDEGPRHMDQARNAGMIRATMNMYTALRRIRSAIEGGIQPGESLHEIADTAISIAEMMP